MQRVLATILVIAGILAAVWISVFVFLGLMVLGAGAFLFFKARAFLTEKGILNPTPGIAPAEDEAMPITIIDGDYERIPEEKKS